MHSYVVRSYAVRDFSIGGKDHQRFEVWLVRSGQPDAKVQEGPEQSCKDWCFLMNDAAKRRIEAEKVVS